MKNTIFFFFVLLLLSCRKEKFTTNPALTLTASADTIRFDTVFTTSGSVTQAFKIFNLNKEGIRVSAIRLIGGAASPFKININGQPVPAVENLEIASNDSIYVFVTVTVPPTTANRPFVVQDSIEITYNGNKKLVQLEAYGQNAHFLRNGTITGTEVWTADLPYVLLGAFSIEKDAHLTIAEGCKIYAHADAPFLVAGTLTVKGKRWDSTRVLFSGDRIDEAYRDLPGSWPGIVFKALSHDNSLHYAIIKNAYQAIAVEASPAANKLGLYQTIIDNAYDAGLLATNSNITAENILISNCGKAIVLRGGTYNFTHATVAGFSTPYLPHKAPVLTVTNAGDNSSYDLNAVFRNCIFWGESGGAVKEEVVINKTETGAFHLLFDGVQWPLTSNPDNAMVTVPAINVYPEFDSISTEKNFYDFHLKENAPARNSGVPTSVSLDLDGNPRPATAPDLGAYQKQ